MSLGDSAALVHAGGAAPADELPPDAWPRYRTKKTIATMTATTKTIMNMSITQPPPEPQYPLPSHIIVGNRLSQLAKQVLTSACPRSRLAKPSRPRPEALRPPAGVVLADGRAGQGAGLTSPSRPTCRQGPSSRRRRNASGCLSRTGGGAGRRT